MKKRFAWVTLLALFLIMVCSGCSMISKEQIKLRDLDMTVLSEERIPEELLSIVNEKKGQPFSLTYKDNQNLFICIGYGEQKSGGYSVVVDELYLTDSTIVVKTSLLGPEEIPQKPTPSYPYIVIRTELLELPVMFE